MLAQSSIHNFMPFTSPQYRPREYNVASELVQDPQFQRPYARSVGSYGIGLSYAQHELLRQRKTPQGRHTETLDVDNFDTNVERPASKHVLLSRSSTIHVPFRQHVNPEREHNSFEATSSTTPHSYTREPFYNERTSSASWNSFNGFEPMASHMLQISPTSGRYHWPISQVPTVLPANLQAPILGPTASAGQQFYGPYWPDGTYSPYRPVPLRDDRFFHFRHSRDISRGAFSPLDISGNTQQGVPYGRKDETFDMYTTNLRPSYNPQVLPPRDAAIPYPSFQDRISNALEVANFDHSIPPIQFSPTGAFDRNRSGFLQPTPSSEKFINQDETFSWAYQIYIELLAQIQYDSKTAKQRNSADSGHGKSVKPAIFPKPPQRARSYFGAMPKGQIHHSLPHAPPGWYPTDSDEPRRPMTAIKLAREPSDPDIRTLRYMPEIDKTRAIFNSQSLADQTSATPGLQSHHGSRSAETTRSLVKAKVALDAMESLCDSSSDFFTDGMLLAGCLAYGIGSYEKALDWYQKILKKDSQHVEAISNIAATLLALGKREDAIKRWKMAIHLRPSYFEAVEHLIGLFVSSHRTKEAVDMISYVESCLKLSLMLPNRDNSDFQLGEDSDDLSRTSSATLSSFDGPIFEYGAQRRLSRSSDMSDQLLNFGSSNYAISAVDNGRLLALLHAKANMLYSMVRNTDAALAFENAILLATGYSKVGIKDLIERILKSCVSTVDPSIAAKIIESKDPILLAPDRAQRIVYNMFPGSGNLPGLECLPTDLARRAAISTTSNCLLSLAKIYQDGLATQLSGKNKSAPNTREILGLYYLSLSLQPSPSTANNVGILLAGVQSTTVHVLPQHSNNQIFNYTGIASGSGVNLALAYYQYGLNLDGNHAHLYTNLGSLLKDMGDLQTAIKMYETAVKCDGNFDIALANLANAVKDQGRIGDAIKYYKRAVQANPEFAEAVCGLATALNSVCNWYGRGGVYADHGRRDRIHVDGSGMMYEARDGCGWMNRVVEIVDRQLRQGETWGIGILTSSTIEQLCSQLSLVNSDLSKDQQLVRYREIEESLRSWAGRNWEGARVVRLLERATKYIGWQWYQDRYKHRKEYSPKRYVRPQLPANVSLPSAPTVLPFHTFTTPLSAKQVRHISQRNALRISVSTLRSTWLPRMVYPPPAPPDPCLRVGYVSSDFNNHPLAHLMKSVFGLHNPASVRAYCYATTPSDGSIHRQQIQNEAPVFCDASSWSTEKLVRQIVQDGLHILVNLNGYTRGAKNEVFAARPAPIHMSFMGFAGTLGAEWCDYVYADSISIPQSTLAPFRYNVDIRDKLNANSLVEDEEDWMYAENVILSRSSFFCVDHKQSAPDAMTGPPNLTGKHSRQLIWNTEQERRWKLRKDIFPELPDTAVILGNFNQLYKIDPTTFRMYLRILKEVPNAILWLLRFPDVGEQNLIAFAKQWAGSEIAKRIIFTDVAPKGAHITRASVVDLFLDTPECNAHTTAADVIWSGTPIITWAKWDYKMCSRMASSIVSSALPECPEGDAARTDLLVSSEQQYEDHAIRLASTLRYPVKLESNQVGMGQGRLMELRRMLWEGRWTSRLFDTKRWVSDLEKAYWKAWHNWEAGIGGDIYL